MAEKPVNNDSPVNDRRPSLKLNALSTWGPLVVNVLIGFLLTPYLMGRIGKESYGIWALVGSFLGYYGLLRLGVGAGLTRYLPFYMGRSDFESASGIASTGFAIYSFVGVLIIAISFLSAGPIADFYDGGAEFVLLIRIMGLAAAIECPMRILEAAVNARERWVLANFITVGTSVIRALGLAGCAYLGYGIVEMGYVILAVTVFSTVLFVITFVKVCPQIHLRPGMVGVSHTRALISFGLLTTIVTLAWSLTLQGHNLIIGKLVSLEAVAIYAVAELIMKNARAAVVSPNRVLWPRFAYLDGENSQGQMRTLFRRATQYNTLFSSGLILLIFVSGPAFIRLWMGKGFETACTVLIILAVGYLVETSLAVTTPLMGGIGRQKVQAALAVTEGTLGFGLSILLTMRMGLAGTALGFAISVALIRGMVSPWYICRLFKTSLARYYLDAILRPWLITLTLALTMHYLRLAEYMDNWHSLILGTFVTGALFSTLAYGICLNSAQKQSLVKFVGKGLERTALIMNRLVLKRPT
ncbi:MAG TPA: oligosaccharide flippase family protein [Sedimentisphaerales bacterium]|nr:oligosaccharide flippase family protein [Sedimentisphaerales bacterium]